MLFIKGVLSGEQEQEEQREQRKVTERDVVMAQNRLELDLVLGKLWSIQYTQGLVPLVPQGDDSQMSSLCSTEAKSLQQAQP